MTAASLFGVMSFMAKLVTRVVPVGEVVFLRFLGSVILILLLNRVRQRPFKIVNLPFLVLRGIFSGAAIFCLFTAIHLIPLAYAVILNCTYPIFSTLFSILFLKEQVRRGTVAVFLVAFLGVYLILNPGFGGIEMGRGGLAALLSGVLAGGAITTVRLLRRTDSADTIFLIYAIVGVVMLSPSMFFSPVVPGVEALLLISGIIAVSTVGQLIMSYAYKFVRVAEGSISSVASVVVAGLLGRIFLNETYSFQFLIGVVLVLGSVFYLTFRGRTSS